ncbi:MAG TPA: class I SAM-dependent methyltransferase [Chloroflexia bacterium]|nr:class I SAM-dependent methyltransferase [Chloroflexia bacterium]
MNTPASTRDRQLAHYYDLEYGDYEDDIAFYVEHARILDPAKASSLLEIGCGTGRIALGLAQTGYRVVCLDTSPGMLAICTERAHEQGMDSRVVPVSGDMRQLNGLPDDKYGMAYCALNTFAYLSTTDDQRAMLTALHRLMQPNGVLLLDLTPPFAHLLPPSEGEIIHQGTYPDSDGSLVHKLVAGHAEPSTQTHHVTLFYDRESGDGTLSRISQSLTLRWTGRYEMELMLASTGWHFDHLYGSYDLDPFTDDSERMIFAAHALGAGT